MFALRRRTTFNPGVLRWRGLLAAFVVAASVSLAVTAQGQILNPNNTKFPLSVGFSDSTIHSFGPAGNDLGPFASPGFEPNDIVFDTSGNLYATNTLSNTIEKFGPAGNDLGTFASAHLNYPVGMAFDNSGNLYASNAVISTVEKFGPTGNYLGAFATAGLDQTRGMAFDKSGNGCDLAGARERRV